MSDQKLKILCVIGTRPEAIKMTPIIKALRSEQEKITSFVCSTAQHQPTMVQQTLEFFDIQADYIFKHMASEHSLSESTTDLLQQLEPVVQTIQPDWILAQGDTTTVFVTALTAYYQHIRFGHIEAGLRTNDRYQPFPEEMYRHTADYLADAHFAPTIKNRNTLIKEGIPEKSIYVTGNTVIDAIDLILKRPPGQQPQALSNLPQDKQIILVTAHRRESFGKPFHNMSQAIRELAIRFTKKVHFVYPVHPNPQVQAPVYAILSDLPNVSLIKPLDYQDLIHFMKQVTFILTDSGGIQEEAPSFRIPVLIMRNKTERIEGLEAGVAKLIGTDRDHIIEEATCLIENPELLDRMRIERNPYGDGKAAQRIVTALLEIK